MEVSCGEVSLAKSELLNEMIDKSEGMDIPFSMHTLSRATEKYRRLQE